MDDTFCYALIKAIQSFTDFADPNTSETLEVEMSTPENGIEPVSVISHLAEQERSFSDDLSTAAVSPTPPQSIPNAELVTPNFERKIQTFADEERVYDTSVDTVDVVDDQTDNASVNTGHEIGDDIYTEEESAEPMLPQKQDTLSRETSF